MVRRNYLASAVMSALAEQRRARLASIKQAARKAAREAQQSSPPKAKEKV
jgi:hypothetical protein